MACYCAKYYLYHQKLTQKNINFNAFTEKLHSKYRIENIVHVNNIKTRLPTKNINEQDKLIEKSGLNVIFFKQMYFIR